LFIFNVLLQKAYCQLLLEDIDISQGTVFALHPLGLKSIYLHQTGLGLLYCQVRKHIYELRFILRSIFMQSGLIISQHGL